jgi:hypothetical protein
MGTCRERVQEEWIRPDGLGPRIRETVRRCLCEY